MNRLRINSGVLGYGGGAEPISLLQLVQNRTLDLRLASLFWLLAEKKASVIVAAGPRLAGKTTVLTALLDMAPPWYQVVSTRGQREDFSFLSRTDPFNTYILVGEISDHLPVYLWGPKVGTVFEALAKGYSLAATVHADSPEEVVELLQSDDVNLHPSLIMRLHAIVNLYMGESNDGLMRRVWRVNFLPDASQNSARPRFLELARWDQRADATVHSNSTEAWASVAQRLGMEYQAFQEELSFRRRMLKVWLGRGLISVGQLKMVTNVYYEERR